MTAERITKKGNLVKDGLKYKPVASSGCGGCAFWHSTICPNVAKCAASERADGKSVIWVRKEKKVKA